MEAFLIFIGVWVTLLFACFAFAGMVLLIYNAMDTCHHSYERVDTCNDKKMILVCRKCGKIKKLRK